MISPRRMACMAVLSVTLAAPLCAVPANAGAGPLSGEVGAAPTWSAPTQMSTSGAAQDVTVAVDAGGATTAAWSEAGVILTRTRVGDAWGEPVVVGGQGSWGSEDLTIGVDGDGGVTIAWLELLPTSEPGRDHGPSRIMVAYRPGGASWQAPVMVSGPDTNASGLRLEIGPGGDALLLWRSGATPHKSLVTTESAFRPAGGSAWQAPERVSQGDRAWLSPVALDEQGNAIVLWVRDAEVFATPVFSKYRSVGDGWQPRQIVAPKHVPGAVAFDAAGTATALVIGAARPETGRRQALLAAQQTADGGWGDLVRVSRKRKRSFISDPMLTINAQGVATAIWVKEAGFVSKDPDRLKVARRAVDGAWRSPRTVYATEKATENTQTFLYDPRLSVNKAGDMLVLAPQVRWTEVQRANGMGELRDTHQLLALYRPRGGPWTEPTQILNGNFFALDGALDPTGDGIAVWARGDVFARDMPAH